MKRSVLICVVCCLSLALFADISFAADIFVTRLGELHAYPRSGNMPGAEYAGYPLNIPGDVSLEIHPLYGSGSQYQYAYVNEHYSGNVYFTNLSLYTNPIGVINGIAGASCQQMSFSPDGKRLYNVCTTGAGSVIEAIDIDPSSPNHHKLLDGSNGTPNETIPLASPGAQSVTMTKDGKRLLVGFYVNTGEDATNDIWVINKNTKAVDKTIQILGFPTSLYTNKTSGRIYALGYFHRLYEIVPPKFGKTLIELRQEGQPDPIVRYGAFFDAGTKIIMTNLTRDYSAIVVDLGQKRLVCKDKEWTLSGDIRVDPADSRFGYRAYYSTYPGTQVLYFQLLGIDDNQCLADLEEWYADPVYMVRKFAVTP